MAPQLSHADRALAQALAAFKEAHVAHQLADLAHKRATDLRNNASEELTRHRDALKKLLSKEDGLVTCDGLAYRVAPDGDVLVERIGREIQLQPPLLAEAS